MSRLTDSTTWTGMFILASVYITVLRILGFPVKPLFTIVRNTIITVAFLLLYNYIGQRYGLVIGINPLTVSVIAIFGIEGFAAISFLLLFV